jgi:hypothetical protein
MSTKTTFKRIALVAVAALGLGVLSVAPSSAAVSSLTITATNGTNGNTETTVIDTTTAARVQVTALTTEDTDSISVTFVRKSAPTLGAASTAKLGYWDTGTATTLVAKVGALSTTLQRTAAAAGRSVTAWDSLTAVSTAASDGYSISGGVGYKDATFLITLETGTAHAAGSYVFTVIAETYKGGVRQTVSAVQDVTITVAALASASKVANAALSSVNIAAGATAAAEDTADAAVSAVATASSTAAATLGVYLRNAADGFAQESVTVTVTGPGVVGDGTTFGKSVVLRQASAGAFSVYVRPDGTAGTASIVVKSDSVTFAAKTVTFYAAAAKTITASTNKPVIAVSTNTAVVYAKAVDANGSAWGGAAYIYASTAADALIAGSATPVACTYVSADDVHACPVSGTSAGTAKFKVIDAATVAAATATSNEVSVRVSVGTPATVKLAFDKSTYAPGEKAQVWVTALDSAGNALPEQTITNLFATGGITSSSAFSAGSDTLTATFAALAGATSATAGTVAGYKVYTVYMPMSSGVQTISATGGTGLATAGRVAVSASAEVVNTSVDAATDAANEATDAANAATDAALAAADAADAATAAAQDASDAVAALSASVSKLISSLRAQITSLTNLVIKIQKKVRA